MSKLKVKVKWRDTDSGPRFYGYDVFHEGVHVAKGSYSRLSYAKAQQDGLKVAQVILRRNRD